MFDKIPNFIKIVVGVALAIILTLFIIFKGQQAWNRVGNKIFEWKIGKKVEDVQKDLDSAAKQKSIIEQSLRELDAAKKELDAVKTENDRLKGIFNDSSKSSAAKVAEFKKSVADDPVHTPTDNITTEDLCTRAKAIGASPTTIITLCGQ